MVAPLSSEPTTDETNSPEAKLGFLQRTTARFPRATRVFAVIGVAGTALVAASAARSWKKSDNAPDVYLVDQDSYRDASTDAPTGTEA